jgi:hypothetical protein
MRRVRHDAVDFYFYFYLAPLVSDYQNPSSHLTYSIIYYHLGLATSIPEVGRSLDDQSATAVHITYPMRDSFSDHIRVIRLLCAIYVHRTHISWYRRPTCHCYFYKTSCLAWPDGLKIHTLHSCSRLCNPLPWAHYETSAHPPMRSLQ